MLPRRRPFLRSILPIRPCHERPILPIDPISDCFRILPGIYAIPGALKCAGTARTAESHSPYRMKRSALAGLFPGTQNLRRILFCFKSCRLFQPETSYEIFYFLPTLPYFIYRYRRRIRHIREIQVERADGEIGGWWMVDGPV